jgi:hypothetical protein
VAAPVYATNLTDITLAQATTNFTAVGGGGAITAETDFYIQDGTCVSKATSATWDSNGTAIGGVLFNNGAGITVPTDGAVLTWMYWWGPGVLATKANGGAEVTFGNATTAYYGQYVSGSDDWAFGGWRCYPVDPNLTPRDRTVGTPNGTWQYFGWNANVAATASIGKGNPYGVDAIRYGRCDLVLTNGDLANGYATFLGVAEWDNTSTRRLGLLIPQNGAYYWQGLLSLGTSGTAVDFRDSNRAIFVANTEKVSSNFNKIEVSNASSRVDWTSVTISALGTVARGNFEAVANADINIDQCVFTDMGTFIFQSNSTILSSTFRRCDQVTAGGAAFTDCLFTQSTAAVAVVASTLNIFDNCSFVSDGTGHAVNLGTIAATTSMNWNCNDSGYAGTNGSTGNETILVNVASGQTLTINVGSGYSTPTYYNTGAGTVSVVSGQVTTTITVVITGTTTAIQNARVYLVATGGGPLSDGTVIFNTLTDSNGQVTDIRSLAADQQVTGWVRKSTGSPYYKTSPISATIDNASGLSLTIQMIPDE